MTQLSDNAKPNFLFTQTSKRLKTTRMDKAMKEAHEALTFHIESTEAIKAEAKVLVIQSAPGSYLKQLPQDAEVTALTFNAAYSDLWSARGNAVCQSTEDSYDLIIHFGTKFNDETLWILGKHAPLLKPDGRWISVVPNKMGAGACKKSMKSFFGELITTSKSKCRVLEAEAPASFDTTLAKKWQTMNKPSVIKGSQLVAVPGIFSANKLDPGSEFLLECLGKAPFSGFGADLGAGYGFLSHQALSHPRHKVKGLHLFELDYRSVECARQNLSDRSVAHFHWCDVTKGLPTDQKFHWILMNPPFHSGRSQNIDLGIKFLQVAAQSLKPGGSLYLVANTHLPYEQHLHELFRSVRKMGENNSFKCYECRA